MLHACRGGEADHPVLRAARELTTLHERRFTEAGETVREIDDFRARHVRDIDRWVAAHLPPARGGAYLHTETVGAILDRLAQLAAFAYLALAEEADWDLWFAWERLAELAVGYEDLVDELSAGRRRLPGGCGE
ncbi:uncharacterized protein DUF4254 [Nocardia tenerifensis]|uniref:Uncharacterized protein DUF4254 n=1 Tax=Nocardia tenerifensis TaxID=228006 RepID=A0A318JVP5_9NOCA|nr:uncharacterized protein DUF4254 [Nocardia tenerifensis]